MPRTSGRDSGYAAGGDVTERRREKTALTALRRVATLVAKGVPPEDLFAVVAEEVARVVDVPVVSIVRYEADDTATEYASFSSGRPVFAVGSRWSLEGTNVLQQIRETLAPARIDDYSGLEGEIADYVRRAGLSSRVGIPIVVAGRLWGAAVVSSAERLPDGTEARLADFTELLAAAIANAESRKTLETLVDEQTALRRLATLVAQEPSQTQIFGAIAEAAMQLLRTDAVRIVRYDGESGVVLAASGQPEVTPPGFRFPLDGETVAARIFRQGKPARQDEYKELSGPVADPVRAAGIRSVVGAPVLAGGRLWGAITTGMTQEEPLPPDTESRLGEFTALMATAISNAEARAEAERLAEEQAALRRVATLVAQGASPSSVLDAVVAEMKALLVADQVALNRFEPGDAIVVLAHRGLDVARTPVDSRVSYEGENVTAIVRRTGNPARMVDYSNARGPLAEIARATGLRSSVSVPIVVEGRVWGLITASWKRDEPPPPETEERMAKFAQLIDTAIANADARGEVARLLDEQATLRRLATLVAEGAAPDEIFAAVTTEVGRVFGTPTAAVGRFEDEGPAITIVGVAASMAGIIPVGTHWLLDNSMASAGVFHTKESARVDFDGESSFDSPHFEAARRLGVVSNIASPILVEGRCWGALSVSATELLPPDAADSLEQFSDIVATAIANAEARREVERLADEQAALRRVAELVAQEPSPVEVFHAVTEEAARVLDSEAVGLLRFESEGTATLLAQSETAWDPPPLGTQFTLEGENPVAELARTGRAARMDDWTSATGSVAAMATVLGVRSAVATPILVEGRLWGTMVAASSAADPLPRETESRIRQFTALVATAIANAEARSEVQRLVDEQAALQRVATLVAEGVAPAEIFSAVSKEVERVFALDERSDLATVVRFDPGPEFVLVGAAKSFEGLEIGSRWGLKEVYVSTKVFRTGRSARVEERDWVSIGGEDAESLLQQGLFSQVGSPIVVEGRVWGAITMNAKKALPPNTEDRLEKFTELVGTAIANADSREALADLADGQAALRRVATLVADQAAPDVIFGSVAAEVAHTVAADRCAIGRYEDKDVLSVVGYWSDEEQKVPAGTRIDVGTDEVVAMVRESSEVLRIDDHEAFSGPLMDYARALGPFPTSTIAAPVFVRGHMWGTIFTSTMAAESFPEGTESRIMDFAELVATAIANADWREALAGLVKEQAALRRVATLVAQGVQPSAIFAAVSREVEGVVGARMVSSVKATVVRFDPRQECVLVGASKAIEGMPLGMRWQPHHLFVSSRVLRTRRPARVEESEVLSAKGRDAEKLRRQGYLSQVGTPIVVESRLWGAMTLSATETLPADTEERLEKFTELVATAIANAENKSELAASRRRIVAASDDARRRIERDLHDGVQQRLVSLGLAVRAAEADVPPDRKDLQEELSRVATGLSETLDGLQELSRGIHPATLSQGGLEPALRMLAHRSAVPVELKLATSDRFREPVEVAAYFVASEALTNAVKHAHASRIDVSLATRARTLELSIRDDGVGGADPTSGSGLVGLVDRVEALGGSIRVRSSAGQGTHITAELPLELNSMEESEPLALPLAAITSAAEALYVIDAQGRIRFLNPAALRILGYDDEKELLGRSSHETIHYMHPDGTAFPAEECPLLLPRVTGEAVHVDEDWFVRQDRTFVRVAYSSAAIPLPGGRGAVVSFRDLPPNGENG
jgi:PAS domain S-box-containing protein